MYTKIKFHASYSQSSGNKKNKGEAFRRFEFNHPLNPFRLIADETRLHLKHHNASDINEGVISGFEKLLRTIQLALTAEEKDINLISTLTNELYAELNVFSTVPCTSNIDTSIFEHLNYILELLYDWQDYVVILKQIEKDTPAYLEIITKRFKISAEEVKVKINHLSKKFIVLTREILSEISKVNTVIKEEHLKHLQRTRGSKK